MPVTALSLLLPPASTTSSSPCYALSGDAEGTVTLHGISLHGPSSASPLLLPVSTIARYPAHQAPVMSVQRLSVPPSSSGANPYVAGQVASCGRAGLVKVWRVSSQGGLHDQPDPSMSTPMRAFTTRGPT